MNDPEYKEINTTKEAKTNKHTHTHTQTQEEEDDDNDDIETSSFFATETTQKGRGETRRQG